MNGQIEIQIVSTKINQDRFMYGELNDQHKNTSEDGWTDRELNGQHLQNNPKEMDG